MKGFNLVKSLTRVINNRKGLLILCLITSIFGVNDAWGNSSKDVTTYVQSTPSGKGYVYVSSSQQDYESIKSKVLTDDKYLTKDEATITVPKKTQTKDGYFYSVDKEGAGYHFSHWSGDKIPAEIGDKEKKNEYILAIDRDWENPTIYANFAPNTYTVAFNGNGASSGSTVSQTFTYDAAQNLNANGFEKKYVVTFNADGGTADKNTLTSSAPFSGWATSADGSVVYSNQQSVSNLSSSQGATVTLYAKWSAYLAITLPNATKSGKVLVGWSDGETTRLAGETYTPTGNITMTAIWMDSYPFTMSCNVNALKVEEAKTPAFTFTYADNPTPHIADASIIAYDKTSNTLTGLKEGTTTIYFTQEATSAIKAGTSDTYTITVSKIANTLAVEATHTMKVDETWNNVYSNKNSDGAITTESTDASVAYFDVANNKIVAPNSSAKSFNSKEVTITIHQDETYKFTAVNKTITVTVNKWDNTLAWTGPSSMVWWSEQASVQASGNSDAAISYSVVDERYGSYDAVNHILYSHNINGQLQVIATQAETYKYKGTSVTLTVNVSKANDHVEFTLNESLCNAMRTSDKSGSYAWDGGIRLGEPIGGGFNYDDKYVVIKFSGIPDKLSCSFSGGSTGLVYQVYQSADGSNWGSAVIDETKAGSANKQLAPTTRYLKFLYSGNFAGTFSDIKVTELRTFSTDKSELDFGSNKKDIACASQTFTFNYANVGHKVTLSTSDNHFSVSPTSITNIGGDKQGSQTITVSYSTAEVHTASNAKLTITDELGNSKKITLSGSTAKKTQTISWVFPYDVEEPAIPIGKTITGAATSSSNLGVIYESSDEKIIEIVDEGKAFKAVKEGPAIITAKQVGTEDWEETSISKTFKGTNKIIQVISWNQNFTRLLTTYGSQTLTAIVNLENAQTGAQTYSKERSDLITYTSQNSSVVSVNGSTLNIVGKGETTLTASVPGDELYESATVTIPVKVREPSDGCEDVLLNNDFGSSEHEFFHYSLTSDMEKEVAIDRSTSAIPGQLSFQHKGKKWGLNYSGEIAVYESTNNGSSWTKLGAVTPSEGTYNTQTYPLSRNATHVKFFRAKSATGYHYIKDVEIVPAQFIESNIANNEIDFGTVTVNSVENKSVTLSYANVKDNLAITKSSSDLTLSCGEIIDLDCGATGTNQITISFNPKAVGDFSDAIQFSDKNSNKNYTLTIKAKVVRSTQHITWKPTKTEYVTIDQIELNATASSNYPVKYYVKKGQDVADFENGVLTIKKDGQITIRAYEPGDAFYEAAVGVDKTFTIRKTKIQLNVSSKDISYGQTLSASEIGTATATEAETGMNNEIVGGGKLIINDEEATSLLVMRPEYGKQSYTLRYIPDNTDIYETSENVLVNITVEPNIKAGDDNWNEATGWSLGHVPTADNQEFAVIAANNTLSEPFTAWGMRVLVDQNAKYNEVSYNGELTIAPTGGLSIGEAGYKVINKQNDDQIRLVIEANNEHVGYVRVNPTTLNETNIPTAMPQAIVQLYSKSYYDMSANEENSAAWQYIGSPLQNSTENLQDIFYGGWIYGWDETKEDPWVVYGNYDRMQPFVGYAFTQPTSAAGYNTQFYGELTSNQRSGDNAIVKALTYTSTTPEESRGFNIVANSWSAPIDISKFETSDFVNADAIIYLYCTGSKKQWQEWTNNPENPNSDFVPGQYISVPVKSVENIVGLPSTIAPMQAFFVKANNTNETKSVKLDYNRLVWGAEYAEGDANKPLFSPRKNSLNEAMTARVEMYIEGSRFADNVFLLESSENSADYERGYDARKEFGTEYAPQFYANTNDGKLSVMATNQLEGTILGLKAAVSDTTLRYTIHFNNIIGEPMVLKDLQTGTETTMSEGACYTFFMEGGEENDARFIIVANSNPGVMTSTNGTYEDKVQIKMIPPFIYISNAKANNLATIYNAMGNTIKQVTFNHNTTISTADMPEGVYTVRVEDSVLKFFVKH